ncbi:glucosaminidase domain-containing protein [Mesobacillus foraminis]|uniref:glucosaminidase domain-containing protein n=1 Tax=Mesobacillus foraminis TaxID=279826 RepID=UPI0013CF0F5E|nr:glucosaminidase domain-containing protein [Mesobacillus foraminis]
MYKLKKHIVAFLIFSLFLLFLPYQSEAATAYQGVALDNPTSVYSQASTNSKVLKGYSAGSILKYHSYSTNWYKATVYVSGRATTGYIPKGAVDTIDSTPETLSGVAKPSPTRIYSKPATGAPVLKQYAANTVLKYESFTSNWYKATIYKSGKAVTGYIYAADVETADRNPASFKGVALQSPTRVYTQTSTGSTALKSYNKDTVLSYESFVPGWYRAKVYVSGKARYGYINAADVVNGDPTPNSYKGVALKSPTKIYSQTNTLSSELKTYDQGRILSYQSFVPGWYQAKVYVSGKARYGYISSADVENASTSSSSLQVRALVDKIQVHTYASTNAPSIKSYSKDTILKVYNFTSSWYKVTVYVNGNPVTGYVYKKETSTNLTPDSYLNLDLRKKANISAADIVNFFDANRPNSHLKDYAQDFIDAQTKYGVNATYLVAHAIWETGWGTSALSNYKHNLYGYGAYDVCPFTCAYYFPTAGDSINSVAYMVKTNYLNSNGAYYYQEHGSTLIGMNVRYATDQNWKNGIANLMERIRTYDDNYYASASVLPLNSDRPSTFGRDIPKGMAYPNNTILKFPDGITGKITEGVSFRSLPYTSAATYIKSLSQSTTVEVLGYNTDVRLNDKYPYDYRWYRISVDGQEGWVYGGSLSIQDLLQVVNITTTLNIRLEPKTGDVIGSVPANGFLKPVLKDGKPEIVDSWYRVYLPNSTTKTGFVSGEYIKVVNN